MSSRIRRNILIFTIWYIRIRFSEITTRLRRIFRWGKIDRRKQLLLPSAPDLPYNKALPELYDSAKSPEKPSVTRVSCPNGVKKSLPALYPKLVGMVVRSTGLEPVRSPTRPSNVRVCQFRHDRRTGIIITPAHPFVKGYAGENLRSFARRTDRFRKKREVRQGEMDGGEGRAHLEQPGVRLLRSCSPNNAPRVARRGAVPSFHPFRRFSST